MVKSTNRFLTRVSYLELDIKNSSHGLFSQSVSPLDQIGQQMGTNVNIILCIILWALHLVLSNVKAWARFGTFENSRSMGPLRAQKHEYISPGIPRCFVYKRFIACAFRLKTMTTFVIQPVSLFFAKIGPIFESKGRKTCLQHVSLYYAACKSEMFDIMFKQGFFHMKHIIFAPPPPKKTYKLNLLNMFSATQYSPILSHVTKLEIFISLQLEIHYLQVWSK